MPTADGSDLTRAEISAAVGAAGWRYVLGTLRTTVAVESLGEALDVAGAALVAAGPDADDRLTVDVRADRVVLVLQTLAVAAVTQADIDAAVRISTRLGELGRAGEPRIVAVDRGRHRRHATSPPSGRSGKRSSPTSTSRATPDRRIPSSTRPAAVPPCGSSRWTPRGLQRNRIHLDVSVPHDESAARIDAALAAGGTLVFGPRRPRLLGAGRSRGQRGLHHHLARPRLTATSEPDEIEAGGCEPPGEQRAQRAPRAFDAQPRARERRMSQSPMSQGGPGTVVVVAGSHAGTVVGGSVDGGGAVTVVGAVVVVVS